MNVSIFIGILIGFTIGITLIIIIIFIVGFKYDGILVIRNDDGEGPYIFLEINDMTSIENKPYVTLKIKKR